MSKAKSDWIGYRPEKACVERKNNEEVGGEKIKVEWKVFFPFWVCNTSSEIGVEKEERFFSPSHCFSSLFHWASFFYCLLSPQFFPPPFEWGIFYYCYYELNIFLAPSFAVNLNKMARTGKDRAYIEREMGSRTIQPAYVKKEEVLLVFAEFSLLLAAFSRNRKGRKLPT